MRLSHYTLFESILQRLSQVHLPICLKGAPVEGICGILGKPCRVRCYSGVKADAFASRLRTGRPETTNNENDSDRRRPNAGQQPPGSVDPSADGHLAGGPRTSGPGRLFSRGSTP